MSGHSIYNIIEIANTHGGREDYLRDLIKEFEEFSGNFGIKFQPLKPDTIAVPDYEHYSVYEKFYFDHNKWASFINAAYKTKDVWLDLFDLYGVEILEKNLEKVFGIKLQASVLNNFEILDALEKVDLSEKKLIVNIAGYEFSRIEPLIDKIEKSLEPEELWIEIGFQAYPTRLIDSGFSKIERIKQNFSHPIVFADHVDATLTDAKYLPVFAVLKGANVIEKHVRLDRETEYDHFSGLLPDDYREYIRILDDFMALENQPFINERETSYLKNSLMIPLLNKELHKGEIPDLKKDFAFKRSGLNGLDVYEIEEKRRGHNVLAVDCKKGVPLRSSDFKKSHIATIIACRLKSARLKRKALKKIGELASIEYCIRNCMKFPYASTVVLASSTADEDAVLKDYTYNDSVNFYRGDPDDVIRRYAKIIDDLKIDIFVRVTGDNPFVDAGLCRILIDSHFENGADYTTASRTAIGANLEIINTSALKKVMRHFPKAEHSEYMGWYFTNNPDHFVVNYVDLPEKYARDYRLTLDYPEDLELYNQIHETLSKKHSEFGLLDIFDLLDNSNLAEINKKISQKDQTDSKLIKTLREKTRIK